jgi:hypothetical protein
MSAIDGITWGHALMLGALIAALYGLWQLSIWIRRRGYGRGTPQYAQGRDGRRYGLVSLTLALLLAGLCLTPLCNAALGGAS